MRVDDFHYSLFLTLLYIPISKDITIIIHIITIDFSSISSILSPIQVSNKFHKKRELKIEINTKKYLHDI